MRDKNHNPTPNQTDRTKKRPPPIIDAIPLNKPHYPKQSVRLE
jgi:hypothetical protein